MHLRLIHVAHASIAGYFSLLGSIPLIHTLQCFYPLTNWTFGLLPVYPAIFVYSFATLGLQVLWFSKKQNQKWVSDLTAMTGLPRLHLYLYCEHPHVVAAAQEPVIPKQTLNEE